MSESETLIEYRGNCHCGAFKYTFKSAELKQAYACNCSICSKNGYVWGFPAKENFTVVKGDVDSTLKSYTFGKHTMAHKFCPTCGTSVMARTPDGKYGINLRALQDLDIESLPVLTSDGAATEPRYEVPEPVAVQHPGDESNVYQGSCHCGAVGYAVLSPEKITTVKCCNCSICSRDAALWIYPPTTTVTFKGLDSLVEYTFGSRTTYHGFCATCGVAIRERFLPPRSDTALNIRTMYGLDLAGLEITKEDNKSAPPAYEV
ncbi:Mss4-like protein [Mycena albidolilacea]|uniref:Mss4-like protein n=1 Tax=Mycena albidolilacea TaxID=1033008 RepID=A0AAD7E7D4_9AGAR|nr:Mss4-like protein [Mycena albidolilacea]